MQYVAGGNFFFGIEMEPALTPLGQRATVPGKRQSLVAAAGKCDEVLLQGVDAEGVGNLVIVQRPVRPVSPHVEFVVLAIEARGDGEVSQCGIVEIAKHRLFRRLLHRLVVVRSLPCRGLGLVTSGTDVSTDKIG